MSSSVPSVVYVNGTFYTEEQAALSALDRGFTLGDGLFETMRARRGRIFRLLQHLARLRQGALVLELPLPAEGKLAGALQEALARLPSAEAVVRLTISRGVDGGRGLALPLQPSPTIVIRATPLVVYPAEAYQRGLGVHLSGIRRNDSSPLSKIKSTNYGDAILARHEAAKLGSDDAVLLNTRGEVACASAANLFIVSSERLLTPPRESGVLPGVTRACVLDLAAALKINAAESPFGPEALAQADEAFLTNSLVGVLPLTRVNGRPIGSGRPGPVTARLAVAYGRLVQEELGN